MHKSEIRYPFSKKVTICPNPSCKRKRFYRYTDKATGEDLHPDCGKCNRINSCGYHVKPSEMGFNSRPKSIQTAFDIMNPTHTPTLLLPAHCMDSAIAGVKETHLYRYFVSVFGEPITSEVFALYRVGASKIRDGRGTSFPQFISRSELRQVKLIAYKPNGRRHRDGKWYEQVYLAGNQITKRLGLKQDTATLEPFFFGGDLLMSSLELPVYIVESEKTALFMECAYRAGIWGDKPVIWLATGGADGCKWTESLTFAYLRDREVVLFPDADKANEWYAKAQEVRAFGIAKSVTVYDVSEIVAEHSLAKGSDMADVIAHFMKGQPTIKDAVEETAVLAIHEPLPETIPGHKLEPTPNAETHDVLNVYHEFCALATGYSAIKGGQELSRALLTDKYPSHAAAILEGITDGSIDMPFIASTGKKMRERSFEQINIDDTVRLIDAALSTGDAIAAKAMRTHLKKRYGHTYLPLSKRTHARTPAQWTEIFGAIADEAFNTSDGITVAGNFRA